MHHGEAILLLIYSVFSSFSCIYDDKRELFYHNKDPQVGSWVIEALWALNTHLGNIQAKLVASWEAALESVWLLWGCK